MNDRIDDEHSRDFLKREKRISDDISNKRLYNLNSETIKDSLKKYKERKRYGRDGY